MNENIKKPISTLVLIEDSREIKVEMSLEDLKREMLNNNPFLSIQDIDGLWYVLPKMVIKMLVSEKN